MKNSDLDFKMPKLVFEMPKAKLPSPAFHLQTFGQKSHQKKSVPLNLADQVMTRMIFKIHFSEPSSSGSQKHKTGGTSSSVGGGPPNSGSGKRLGRPPKKGTHLPVNSLGGTSLTSPRQSTSSQHGTSAGETSAGRKRSPASSPEREEGDESQAKRSKKKSNKRSVQDLHGVNHSPHLKLNMIDDCKSPRKLATIGLDDL